MTSHAHILDAVVIGAGQAGLAAGYHLRRTNRSFVILESADAVGGSWQHYYESLKLFSPAHFSSLPGLPIAGNSDRYLSRDEVTAYLQSYAAHFQLPIVTGTPVDAVEHDGETFTIQTANGQQFRSRQLIAATGSFSNPVLPTLPEQETYRGHILHSFAYRNPAAFRGRRVVVVGAGNSAVQIAAELAQVAHVTLASREQVQFIEQRPLGRDVHFWWWLLRFDTTPLVGFGGGIVRRLIAGRGTPVLDTGIYQTTLAQGRPDRRPLFEHFTPDGVVWGDGQAEQVDVVIFATGYRPNLSYLAPLDALNDG